MSHNNIMPAVVLEARVAERKRVKALHVSEMADELTRPGQAAWPDILLEEIIAVHKEEAQARGFESGLDAAAMDAAGIDA